jgi:hypothetical protein
MPGTVILEERRPVKVLHDGRWLDRYLEVSGIGDTTIPTPMLVNIRRAEWAV